VKVDVVSNTQISQRDNRETSLLRTIPAPVGHLAEAQSGRETLDAELTAESDGSQMLPLWLRL
jgi:hypothetical protein